MSDDVAMVVDGGRNSSDHREFAVFISFIAADEDAGVIERRWCETLSKVFGLAVAV
jgi:hypothetical protein